MKTDEDIRILELMVRMHCHGRHGEADLCDRCRELLDYAVSRSGRCVQPPGTACAACPSCCYRPEMRDRMREAMRYSGPRMAIRHPLLAFRHLSSVRKGTRSHSE